MAGSPATAAAAIADSTSVEGRIIQRILAEADRPLAPADIQEDSQLRSDLGLSSLQAVSLVLAVEDEFGVRIDDDELQALVTVGDVIRLVRAKQAAAAAVPANDAAATTATTATTPSDAAATTPRDAAPRGAATETETDIDIDIDINGGTPERP